MIGKKVALFFCTLFIILGINGKETIQSQSENKTLVIDSERITEINDESCANISTTDATSKFIYVSGQQMFNTDGSLYRIKGMGFGNNVWSNPQVPTYTHNDEKSYKELSKLGFNTVRFYMNYRIFEDDDKPYQYKEAGFAWLDQNIKWAKKYGIHLILNMHVPQGGFLSESKVNFWLDQSNMTRYEALWKEIAKRYANEPTVLGYALMNEPFLPKMQTDDASLNLYYDFINKVIREIRNEDVNHIFFIERPYGTVDSNRKCSYAWGNTGSFRTVSDTNTVYEFHYYIYQYTAQGTLSGTFERPWYYGDDTLALLAGSRQLLSVQEDLPQKSLNSGTSAWQLIESPIYDLTTTSGDPNYGYWIIYAMNPGSNAQIYVDDIVVKEYDSNNSFVRNVYGYGFDRTTSCSGWDLSSGGGGTCKYVSTDGHDGAGCEVLSGIGANYRFYKNFSLYNNISLRKGYKYQITAYIKADNAEKGTQIIPALQLAHADAIYGLNKDYIASQLNPYLAIAEQYNVPIYIGEIGATSHIIGNEYKGEQYLSDLFDYLNAKGLGYSYHDYHEENYGLYTTKASQTRGNVDKILLNLFKTKVKK